MLTLTVDEKEIDPLSLNKEKRRKEIVPLK